MRVFLCIEPNEEVKSELERIIKEIQKTNLISGKYVGPENLHLTLKFFGELPEKKVDEVIKKLEDFKFKKFEASTEQIGYFSERFIRVLWVGFKCGKMAELSNEIEKLLGKNDKEFSCHLTLARMRNIKDKQKFKNFIKNLKVNKISFLVDKIILKKSVLTEKGPIYSDLYVKELE